MPKRRGTTAPSAPNAWLGWLAYAWQKFGALTVVAGALLWLLHADIGTLTTSVSQLVTAQAKAEADRQTAIDQMWLLIGAAQRNCLNTLRVGADPSVCVLEAPRR